MENETKKYLMITEGIYKKIFNIGDVVYAKKDPRDNEVYFYDKNSKANMKHYGMYGGIIENDKIVLDEIDIDLDKRHAFIITSIEPPKYTLEFLYTEEDEIIENDKAIYENIIYRIVNNKAYVCGFTDDKKIIYIPSKINEYKVFAIGNVDENGNYIPLEMDDSIEFEIHMSDGIKEICPLAFTNKTISSIEFSNTLYYIGFKSFYGTNIKSIDLRNTEIDSIEEKTFEYSKIKSVFLPEGLSVIKRKAFKGSELGAVEFNGDIALIEEEAFYGCELDTNRCNIERTEKNAFTCCVPLVNIECENINYDNVEYKIYGRVKNTDYITDKILEKIGIDEITECSKQIFFAKGNGEKYEIVLEFDSDYGNENNFIEYLKYKDSVRLNMYKVKEFCPERYFETCIPDRNYVRISGRIENGKINVKTEDGKITGVKLSERYRYIYDGMIYDEYNSGEFSIQNRKLIDEIIFEEKIEFENDEEEENYKKARKVYDEFKNLSKKGEI